MTVHLFPGQQMSKRKEETKKQIHGLLNDNWDQVRRGRSLPLISDMVDRLPC